MKVQHSIQQGLASFWAFLPVEGSLRVGSAGGFEFVYGEYAARRQVFVDYYRAAAVKVAGLAPHFQFARSGDSVEEILRFTAEWGPLRPNRSGENLLRIAFGPEASPVNYFAFYADEWRAQRRELAEAIRLVETDDIKMLRKLLPYQYQGQNPVRTAALYPYLETGSTMEILERRWTEDGRMSQSEVRRTAKACGIFVGEREDPKYRMVFEATSLMDAFWHMLLLDLTVRRWMVRTCANPKCMKPFHAEGRADQKYCEADCARRVANLAHYHRKGADRRRELKKERRDSKPQ